MLPHAGIATSVALNLVSEAFGVKFASQALI